MMESSRKFLPWSLSSLLFFPSISSGPIDRSRRFHEDYEKVYTRQEYLELLGDGLMKIMLGLVYKIVLQPYLQSGWKLLRMEKRGMLASDMYIAMASIRLTLPDIP